MPWASLDQHRLSCAELLPYEILPNCVLFSVWLHWSDQPHRRILFVLSITRVVELLFVAISLRLIECLFSVTGVTLARVSFLLVCEKGSSHVRDCVAGTRFVGRCRRGFCLIGVCGIMQRGQMSYCPLNLFWCAFFSLYFVRFFVCSCTSCVCARSVEMSSQYAVHQMWLFSTCSIIRFRDSQITCCGPMCSWLVIRYLF